MTVIKKTRLKFFTVTAAIIVIIVAAFCASILIPTNARNKNSADMILNSMVEGFGKIPLQDEDMPQRNRIDRLRGFTVGLDADFNITGDAVYDERAFTPDEIESYVSQLKKFKKNKGKIGDLKFLVKNTSDDGKIAAFIDVSMEREMLGELTATVLGAGGGGALVLLILVWFLSRWIVKPAADALKKQKRFISEAGHELKTPLTVISAGLELLTKSADGEERENRIRIIKEQTEKMSAMTAELLTLSKLDETEKTAKTDFDLSRAVLAEALAFESVAFESGKTLVCKIEPDIFYKGDAQAAGRAARILCDNAVKHSDPGGPVEVSLKRQAGQTVLEVSNPAGAVKKEELPLLFERFYRCGESRASVSGAGLGLAILKTLAESNGWKLSADVLNNMIKFTIIF